MTKTEPAVLTVNKKQYGTAAFICLVLGTFFISVAFNDNDAAQDLCMFLGPFLLVCGIANGVIALRGKYIVDSDGLTHRTGFGTRHYPWGDVVGFRVKQIVWKSVPAIVVRGQSGATGSQKIIHCLSGAGAEETSRTLMNLMSEYARHDQAAGHSATSSALSSVQPKIAAWVTLCAAVATLQAMVAIVFLRDWADHDQDIPPEFWVGMWIVIMALAWCTVLAFRAKKWTLARRMAYGVGAVTLPLGAGFIAIASRIHPPAGRTLPQHTKRTSATASGTQHQEETPESKSPTKKMKRVVTQDNPDNPHVD
jgi:hypothetical protein